jgi:hypothetical protein
LALYTLSRADLDLIAKKRSDAQSGQRARTGSASMEYAGFGPRRL